MNPYKELPKRAFWRPAVADLSMFDIEQLWDPKFEISKQTAISTFGSCFAQHIGATLQDRGFNWFVAEPVPPGMSAAAGRKYNYEVFSARTGNIYTASLLKQWVEWALGVQDPPCEVWQDGSRFFDPFRPQIEPGGFVSKDELLASRAASIESFRKCIESSDVFVFTLGLTESWANKGLAYEYPVCPGTVAGEYDPYNHVFRNQKFNEIRKTLKSAIEMMRMHNKRLKILLTVSPVPLTATNSGKHVLVGTMASKSVLRAVCSDISDSSRKVDYFPSYEIINSPAFRGIFFEPNGRNVNPAGVSFVMDHFFQSLKTKYGVTADRDDRDDHSGAVELASEDEKCEEEILENFKVD